MIGCEHCNGAHGVCTCRRDVYVVHAGRTLDTVRPQMTFGGFELDLVLAYARALLVAHGVRYVTIEQMEGSDQ